MHVLCKSCNRLVPTGDFYESNKGSCKECVRARALANRWANIEHRREYDRERGQLTHRKAANAARAHRYVGKYEPFKDRHPHKRAAHIATGNAIRDGKLVPQSCEWCGASERVQAHHEDYSKPLDVMWLCTSCHGERHRQINEERRQEASQ